MIDIENLAKISRLNIHKSQYEAINLKLSSVLKWINEIQIVETENVEPMINILYDELNLALPNQDIAINKLLKSEIFKNTKHSDENFFLVPRVIE